jgi:hypothetical protein
LLLNSISRDGRKLSRDKYHKVLVKLFSPDRDTSARSGLAVAMKPQSALVCDIHVEVKRAAAAKPFDVTCVACRMGGGDFDHALGPAL